MKGFLALAALLGSISAFAQVQVAPVAVSSASSHHTCTIDAGNLLCWGRNYSGQVGDGTNEEAYLPQVVVQGNVTAVAVGEGHTCAIVKAALWCWGDNGDGQLGIGDNTTPQTAEKYRPTMVLPSGVTAVTAGEGHTCALHTGKLKCWGRNNRGQLGTSDGDNSDVLVPTLVLVQKLIPAQVKAGESSTCAIMKDTSVWCWGDNTVGQLGNNTTVQSNIPVNAVLKGATVLQAGAYHNCALVTGKLQCWGGNEAGQLGTGTTDNSIVPVDIVASGVTNMALGEMHLCWIRYGALWDPLESTCRHASLSIL